MIKKSITILITLLIIIPTTLSAKEKTIIEWQNELNRVQKELENTNNKKSQTQGEINSAQGKVNSIYSQISKVNEEIEAKTKQSAELEDKIKIKNQQLKDLMRYYQISSTGTGLLEYVMGAESISDLIYRLSITEQIGNYNKKTIAEMNDIIRQNEEIKKELNTKNEELSGLQKELNSKIAELNKTKSSLDEEGHTLSESIKEMQKTIADLKKLGCKDNETQTVCLNRIYSKKSGGYLPSGTTFYRPMNSGRISSEYGWRTLRGSPNLHAAIDMSTPIGTPVYAVAPGRVAKVIHGNTGGGNQIIIHHQINGKYYTSYYCHLSVIGVSAGTIVTKDTVIGKSGNTGNSTGPHLHLGLANGRWYTDYYSYYGSNGFVGYSFNPRNVIIFPPLGSSFSNR